MLAIKQGASLDTTRLSQTLLVALTVLQEGLHNAQLNVKTTLKALSTLACNESEEGSNDTSRCQQRITHIVLATR